jgi:hypothetical protein
MAISLWRRFSFVWLVCLVILAATSARADEIWVTPTAQQDLGGLGIGSNIFWPATAAGAARMAWSIPDNLKALQSAKVVLIPHSPSPGSSTLNIFVCSSKTGDVVSANCIGPSSKPFVGVANQLVEVEVAGILGPYVGTPGANYLAVIAYTTPTTATDHILGLRFGYEPTQVSGMATLAANTFSGTQTAPAFVGDGSGLTGLPFPVGAATLGANTFGGTQTAPAFAGSGASLTGVAKLAANTFTGTQTIDTGNLDLDNSTATTGLLTKNGQRFLHNYSSDNVYLGVDAGNFTASFRNTAIGRSALSSISGGVENTASGYFALLNNTVGHGNTANGRGALLSNTTGGANTAIGAGALSSSVGDFNTAVGYSAGSQATTGSNNIYLGYFATGQAGESNAMYLGNGQTKTVIAGIRGVTTGAANAIPVVIDANGQLGTISSSVRFKEDIHDMAAASQRLFDLRPVIFRYTKPYADGSKPVQFGLVAEEVAEVFPELAVRDANGNVETVHYETLNVLLLNELKNEHDEAQHQRQRIEILEQRLNELLNERTKAGTRP